jgi:hypothetical protein
MVWNQENRPQLGHDRLVVHMPTRTIVRDLIDLLTRSVNRVGLRLLLLKVL